MIVYGGINEVGGNKILMSCHDERVLFDFGKSYSRWSNYYGTFFAPKSIEELIAVGLLPSPVKELKGLYTKLPMTGRARKLSLQDPRVIEKVEADPLVKACFFSHIHGDHVLYLSFLNRKIRTYMGRTTTIFHEAIQEHTDFDIERDAQGFVKGRNLHTFQSEREMRLNHFRVTPLAVDHSVPAAYGFIVECEEGTLVYTGDFRCHGSVSYLTDRFLEKARNCDVLICEGTCFSKPVKRGATVLKSEADVEEKVIELTEKSEDLVMVNISSFDTDRINTIFKVSKQVRRSLVLNLKAAATLSRLKMSSIKNFPKLEEIWVFREEKELRKWQRAFYHGAERSDLTVSLKEDEKANLMETEWRFGKNMKGVVNADDIVKNPSEYVLITSFYSLSEMREILERNDYRPLRGVYIMSTSEPYSEELEIELAKLKSWVRLLGLNFAFAHCSGHVHEEDLERAIDYVKPKKIIPIHTGDPRAFNRFKGTLRPRVGRKIFVK